MSTFEDFARAAKMTAQDKTGAKRLEEILSVLRDKRAYKDMTPQKAVEILEALGPTFVKLGQLMSDRTDVLPKEYCEAFATLRDDAVPIPFEEVLALLNENYAPRSVEDIFQAIDPLPLGSASIAQVHKATLGDGRRVAVKVRRPGIKETMSEDVALMQHLVAVAQLVSRKHENILFTASGFVDEIAKTTQQETDLGNEMENLIRFREELASSGERARGISSPIGFPEISSESVLVMEYIEGDELAKVAKDANAAQRYDLDDIAKRMAQSYIEQFLEWGFFTSDPHMGNIILGPHGDDGAEHDVPPVAKAKADVEVMGRSVASEIELRRKPSEEPSVGITWIDMGMMGTLTSVERELVSQIFASVARDDVFSLRRAVTALTTKRGEVDDSELLEMLSSVLSKYRSANLTDIDVGDVLTEVLGVLQRQNLIVNPSVTMLVRGVVVMEGVLAQISPSTSIIEIVSEHVMASEATPEKLSLRARNLAGNMAGSVEAASKIPTQVSNALDMLEMGELSVTGKLDVNDKTLSTIYASVSRLCLALLSVGLFLGSALLCLTDMEPKVLGAPLLGVLGFVGAAVLGAYLLVRIMKSKHAMSNHGDPRA